VIQIYNNFFFLPNLFLPNKIEDTAILPSATAILPSATAILPSATAILPSATAILPSATAILPSGFSLAKVICLQLTEYQLMFSAKLNQGYIWFAMFLLQTI
jgi:hypothetical protein